MTRGALTVNGMLKILDDSQNRKNTGLRAKKWVVAPEITTLGADSDLGVYAAEDGSFQLKGLPPGQV